MNFQSIDHLPILGDASLETLDWARLKGSDDDECRKLVRAGKSQGFLYLDLSSEDVFLHDWDIVLEIMDQYFRLDLEEKTKDNRRSDTHGYEPVATSSGAVKGLPDYYESLKSSRDEMLAKSNELPPIILNNHELFLRFCGIAHDVVMTVLRRLSLYLCPGQDLKLEQFHRDGHESLTTLAMFRYPKQNTTTVGVGHGKHTDLGTLTFLLCQQWGLQVLSTNDVGWHFVAPRKNHVVINVGDTLRFLTGNCLRSGVHRVVPTGQLQQEDRYSIAYFLRAEHDVSFKDTTGRSVTAKTWHDEKFDVFREPHEQQEEASVLTGGMEYGESLVV